MAVADAVERRVRMRDGVELWTSSSWVTDEDDDGGAQPALVLVHGGPGLWDHLEPVAEALPRAELVVVEGAGHLPWEDRPAEFASALRRFLQAHA